MTFNANLGDTITFGSYPHATTGEKAPIRWQVLHNDGTELFVISEYLLNCKRFHSARADVTWQDSDVRSWLNDDFYHTAFNEAEQRHIVLTHCRDNGETSPDTRDKVFLLSVKELNDFTDIFGKDLRRAIGTGFAKVKKADGCKLYVYDKGVEQDCITKNGTKYGCSWWLRTQLR